MAYEPMLLGYTNRRTEPEIQIRLKKKIFIVCPVRRPHVGFLRRISQMVFQTLFSVENQWTKTQSAIKAYVEKLESEGYEVYWPARDNPYQNTDKIGIQIITFNRQKMLLADEIHVWYYKTSAGSNFDYGMFFAFVHVNGFKKFVIINREDIAPTPHKSFENVLLVFEKEFDNPVAPGLK